MAGCTPAQPSGHPTSIPSIWLSGTGRASDLSLSWQDPWTSLQIVLGVQLALHIPTAISNNLNEHEATCAMWIILNLPTGSALYGPIAVTTSMLFPPSETLRSFLKLPQPPDCHLILQQLPENSILVHPHQWRSVAFSLLHLVESPIHLLKYQTVSCY